MVIGVITEGEMGLIETGGMNMGITKTKEMEMKII